MFAKSVGVSSGENAGRDICFLGSINLKIKNKTALTAMQTKIVSAKGGGEISAKNSKMICENKNITEKKERMVLNLLMKILRKWFEELFICWRWIILFL